VFVSFERVVSSFPTAVKERAAPANNPLLLAIVEYSSPFLLPLLLLPLLCHFTRPKQPFNGRPLFGAGNPQQQHPA